MWVIFIPLVDRQVATNQITLTSDSERFIEEFKKDPKNQEWLNRKLKAFDYWRKIFSPRSIERLSQVERKRVPCRHVATRSLIRRMHVIGNGKHS
jgi:ribonuclease HI